MRLIMWDCENISPIPIIPYFKNLKNTNVVLIYGKEQKAVDIDAENVTSIVCKGTGHNYADFVLITELSRRIYTETYQSVSVVSRDTGFVAAIDFLKENGINIQKYNLLEFIAKYYKSLKIEEITHIDFSNPEKKPRETKTTIKEKTKRITKRNQTTTKTPKCKTVKISKTKNFSISHSLINHSKIVLEDKNEQNLVRSTVSFLSRMNKESSTNMSEAEFQKHLSNCYRDKESAFSFLTKEGLFSGNTLNITQSNIDKFRIKYEKTTT